MQSSKHPVENRMFYNKDLETNNADDSGKHCSNRGMEYRKTDLFPTIQLSRSPILQQLIDLCNRYNEQLF